MRGSAHFGSVTRWRAPGQVCVGAPAPRASRWSRVVHRAPPAGPRPGGPARAWVRPTGSRRRPNFPRPRHPLMSQTAMSARFPTSIRPQSPRPSTSAPPRVAIQSASRALIAAPLTRCKSIAWRASATEIAAVVAGRSVDAKPTRTPASRIARTGAIPDPSRAVRAGTMRNPVPVRAKSPISAASSFTQCACQTSRPVQPSASA